MVKVMYWETKTKRTQEEPLGIFNIPIEPEEVAPINVTLTGEALKKDTKRFEEQTEKAVLNAKFAALDRVRGIVGDAGILVANIVEESEEE